MAYELSIERNPELSLEEWRATVEANPLLRYGVTDVRAVNPNTGEVITIRGVEDDASVELDGQWTPLFRWRKGRVTFNGRAIENPDDHITRIAFSLAQALGAAIRGEEGEAYFPAR